MLLDPLLLSSLVLFGLFVLIEHFDRLEALVAWLALPDCGDGHAQIRVSQHCK